MTQKILQKPQECCAMQKKCEAEQARRLGLSRQTVNNIVNGRRSTTVGRLHEIAEALQVRVRELFDE